MTTAIRRRRGSTSQHSTFTGLEGEVTVDTTKETLVVHDGATAGGFPLLREDLSNNSNVATLNGIQTLSGAKTFSAAVTFSAGSAAAPAITTTGDSNTGIFFPAADTIAFSEGGVESMRLDASGNLGIGVTATNVAGNRKLEVGGTTNSAVVLSTNSSNAAARNWATAANFNAFGDYVFLQSNALGGDPVSAGTTRMMLNSIGNLGIGTTSPAFRLDVTGTINSGASNATGYNHVFRTSGITTGRAQTSLTNTSGDFWTGIEGSTAGQTLTGSAAYSAFAGTFTANPLYLVTNGSIRTTLDSSGNLGLGVTPSAWASGYRALQIGATGALWQSTGGFTFLSDNAFVDSGAVNRYITTNFATLYRQQSGQHNWFTAPSGTAGTAISFTQAMTLDASGNLGVGTTTMFNKLNVYSTTSGDGISIETTGAASLAMRGATENRINGVTNVPLTFRTNNTEAMRLDASGNLGIGTTTIGGGANDRQVTVSGSSSAQASFTSNGAVTNSAGANTTLGYIGTTTNHPFIFTTNNAERARIDSSGNFVVARGTGGDTTVGFTAYANGTVTAARSSSNNGDLNLYVYSTGAAAARFYVGMGGTVYATSTTITAISDQRLKENIQDIDVGLEKVLALKPRKFDWKEGKGKNKKGDRGWIAQEFEQVFPDMIDTWADPAPEGEEPYKAVNADLIPVLVKAIQEQQAIINQLKARLDAANL